MKFIAAAVALLLSLGPTSVMATEEDIISVMLSSPLWISEGGGRWQPGSGQWRVVELSPCIAIKAELTEASCRIERDGTWVGTVRLAYGYWDGDRWNETVVPQQIAALAEKCASTLPKNGADCRVQIRGYPYRMLHSNGDITFRVRAYNVQFVD